MLKTAILAIPASLFAFIGGISPISTHNGTTFVPGPRAAVAAEAGTVVASGDISGAGGRYQGSGRAVIRRTVDGKLFLDLRDFRVTRGPDLKVWLVAHAGPRRGADVTGSRHISLGGLKRSSGGQSYLIPKGTDLAKYTSVVIWCEAFGVLFAGAPLGSGS
ncbi:MAG TPA: DM13 domain-containing protein [Alphaproteobacteria bacterium]|nr:DM13 domain-containing protein [Alphaproteobacteria bacterium]